MKIKNNLKKYAIFAATVLALNTPTKSQENSSKDTLNTKSKNTYIEFGPKYKFWYDNKEANNLPMFEITIGRPFSKRMSLELSASYGYNKSYNNIKSEKHKSLVSLTECLSFSEGIKTELFSDKNFSIYNTFGMNHSIINQNYKNQEKPGGYLIKKSKKEDTHGGYFGIKNEIKLKDLSLIIEGKYSFGHNKNNLQKNYGSFDLSGKIKFDF